MGIIPNFKNCCNVRQARGSRLDLEPKLMALVNEELQRDCQKAGLIETLVNATERQRPDNHSHESAVRQGRRLSEYPQRQAVPSVRFRNRCGLSCGD
jgi:hypothetical protein